MSERYPAEPDSNAGSVSTEPAFLDGVRRCVDDRRPTGRSLAILFIDTGVIGGIDAVWGYEIGDAVRDRISTALRSEVLRPEDPLGEMGRDMLACALTAVDDPSVALFAAEKTLRVLSMPFLIGDDEIHARPAIGIAMWPAHGEEPQVLLQCARTASLISRANPGHVVMYSEGLVNSGAAQFLYQNRLRSAVAEDALDLVFHPIYDLRLGHIMGMESLLRSRDPRMGIVPVADAFAAAESAGVVTALISSVLHRALRNCSEFRYSAGLDMRIAANLPARVLLQSELPDLVERALRTWNLRAGRLVLEIGETSVLATDALARATLGKLREIGVRLSIDDPDLSLPSLFGLAAMPFQEIKIDISGVTDLGAAEQPARIMRTLVELGHHLKLDVVAIGAADDAAENCLKDIGCDYTQSDRRASPLDALDFVKHYGLA